MNAPSAAAAIAAAVVLACASTSTGPKLTWLRSDGTPATQDELKAAEKACFASTPTDASSLHPRSEPHAYGSKVIDCIERKGYQLVEEAE